MKRITLHVELEYDDEQMHGGDVDAVAHAWFYRDVLGGPLHLVSDEVGDVVGDIVECKVVLSKGVATCPACGSADHDGWTNRDDCPEDWTRYSGFEARRQLQLANERVVNTVTSQEDCS